MTLINSPSVPSEEQSEVAALWENQLVIGMLPLKPTARLICPFFPEIPPPPVVIMSKNRQTETPILLGPVWKMLAMINAIQQKPVRPD